MGKLKIFAMHQYTNALIKETSPYLLQHAHNPVNWFAWNDDAWQKAKQEDKLVIISIGYSACHWCHVMEHESFENIDVATLMNHYYVSIKVDREERPDVDQIYMDAVQLITGRGGWPLNAICLPDGRPVYAGTYFPKQNWMQVLQYFVHEYQTSREKLIERAADITNGIKLMDNFEPAGQSEFSIDDANTAAESLLQTIDLKEGGRAGAPKFPMPVNYQFLLLYHQLTGNKAALDAVTLTLDKMLLGGIYDQVGGGFARYSVDAYWEIPHFEKMLYDNAQLISLYAQAYTITQDEHYKRVVYETLEFIARELTGPENNFYAALDADSEGEEGKFYVWEYEDLKKILGNDFPDFSEVFNVSPVGNFEGSNHLTRKSKTIGNTSSVNTWRNALLANRSKRIRPGLDDKSLTAWNALMLKGYIDAANAFNDNQLLQIAITNANFIVKNQLQKDYSLHRNYKNGKSNISGFLDDYAFVIQAFIALYESTLNEDWLIKAANICDYTVEHFYDEQRGIFYYTNTKDTPLIARKTETSDNVIPASNSVMAHNLYRLGLIFDNLQFTQTAQLLTANMLQNILRHTSFYANWASLLLQLTQEPYIIAIHGTNALELRQEFNKHQLPPHIFIGTTTHSNLPLLQDKQSTDTKIYVCRHRTCGLPQTDVISVLNSLKQ